MITGINIKHREEFTSKHDKSNPKTTFILRPLTGPEQLDLTRFVKSQPDGKGGIKGYIELSDEAYIKGLLGKVIVEVRNYKGASSTLEIIDTLPTEVLLELVQKAGSMAGLTEGERKNSSSP